MSHVPADERRRAIIDAAVKVIVREGPARATTRRVAEVANAPLASLHYTFRNKEEIFRAVIERCLDVVDDQYKAHFVAKRSLRDAVRGLLKLNMQWCRREPGFHIAEYELLFWALRTPTMDGFARYMYERWFERIGALLGECLADTEKASRNIERLSHDVVAVIDGMILQIIALGADGPGPEDVDRLADAAMISFRRPG